MPGGACKAAICVNELAAASTATAEFVNRGLTSDIQQKEIIKISEDAIAQLNKIAEEIPNP